MNGNKTDARGVGHIEQTRECQRPAAVLSSLGIVSEGQEGPKPALSSTQNSIS